MNKRDPLEGGMWEVNAGVILNCFLKAQHRDSVYKGQSWGCQMGSVIQGVWFPWVQGSEALGQGFKNPCAALDVTENFILPCQRDLTGVGDFVDICNPRILGDHSQVDHFSYTSFLLSNQSELKSVSCRSPDMELQTDLSCALPNWDSCFLWLRK